ncbi:hypothetical protein WL29_20720 [Burkholderia ubonensis]|uniref:Uncharacterized protein n=1 Tax=Burkholderia ubonensis TaxID=101571 RepID=A0A119HFD6_9BURK|nr:hypothetical protein WL29_20720 [Burkholderia ubonensis]
MLDLVQFNKDHPPRDFGNGPWRERAVHELFLHSGVRVRLAVDQANDIGHGLWRDDQLAEADISAAEVDSKAFAEQVNAALGPHLSIRNLQDLVMVFGRELANAEARREDALRRAS